MSRKRGVPNATTSDYTDYTGCNEHPHQAIFPSENCVS